ncbi:hypothetical protein SOMG_04950 [Schizosaccharomyces osmophilus]|uniref:Uncharacterized protein n=1 Tax=Schizosaccharomyces osmophilus TaxID=2545709 RepID=A0AAE9WF07_9SCHI|nr:uncharacterized protein SOMG_04950 [Schizosaccharomyces osmophilus]WBW75089.1 hypothetical protein SOMG_04950 [Schizosaccharomyces osmophilus]
MYVVDALGIYFASISTAVKVLQLTLAGIFPLFQHLNLIEFDMERTHEPSTIIPLRKEKSQFGNFRSS